MLNKLQFQNLAELQLQNLDQPLCSKSEKSLVLGPNVSSQICNKLLPTWSSASTWAKVTTSTSFELASSHARATSIKFTKQELVSEWVSQSVSDKHSQWSDSGPIKMREKISFMPPWPPQRRRKIPPELTNRYVKDEAFIVVYRRILKITTKAANNLFCCDYFFIPTVAAHQRPHLSCQLSVWPRVSQQHL